MKKSTVAFAEAPGPVASARALETDGRSAVDTAEPSPAFAGLPFAGPPFAEPPFAEPPFAGLPFAGLPFAERDGDLAALDARFGAALQGLVAEDALVAASDARRARLLAELASIADRRARLDGTAVTSSGREWARRRLAAEVGCATRRSERTVTRLVDEGERLVERLPLTLAALDAGTVSYAHARAMIAHANTLPVAAQGAFEAQLLPEAESLPAFRFEDRARRLRELAHPESIIMRTRAAHEERRFTFAADCDGMATLIHHLPVVDALAIDDLANRLARAARSEHAPADMCSVPDCADPSCAGDASSPGRRTLAQRRSDVVRDLLLGRGERPCITPTVLVTVPATTIAGASDAPGDLHGYGPIDAETARALAATAPTFLRALLRPESGEPTVVTRHRFAPSAGRDRYSASPMLRTALALLDETCRFPGCGRRANRCELDHTRAWSEGGTTTPDNLAHL